MKKKLVGIFICMLLIVPAFTITAVANEPPSAPEIDGPTVGDVNVEYVFMFRSVDPDGDEVYYYIDWGDGNETGWVGPYTSGEKAEISHSWEEPGTYTIQAKAKDSHGAESEWDFLEINIYGYENSPSAPTIDGPTSGHPGIDYNYTFVSCDPEGDDVYYFIIWGDGTVEYYIGPYPSCQIVEISHKWPSPGTYNIGAIAMNINGNVSNWSDPYEVVIVNEPPNAPTITGQTSGKTGTEYEYSFKATDPDGDYISYFVEWGDNTSDGWTAYHASGADITLKHTWSEEGTYNIIAKSKDMYGAEGPEGSLKVTMPKNRAFNLNFNLLDWLFEQLPILEVFLRAMNL